MSAYRDLVNSIEARVFNRLTNLLIDLPGSRLTDFLQGALLLVRRNLFSQAPEITPSTPSVSRTGSGTISGRIGGIDVDGQSLTYSLASGPTLGTVTVGTSGNYTYIPGADYAGADVFTVKVAPARRNLNLFTPFDNGAREVSIEVGAPAPTTPFQSQQANETPADVSVYLPEASAHIAVWKSALVANRYSGTVTLTDVAPGTQLMWMDSTGNIGQFSLDQAAQTWRDFQTKAGYNGGGVDLGVIYTAADGAANAVLLSKVSLTTNALGQYEFTGRLSGDPAVHPDSVDTWDMLGREYQQMFENFRTSNNIGAGWESARVIEFDVAQAALFSSTYSPVSYEQDGLYAFDYPAAPTTSSAPASGTVATPAVTAAAVNADVAQSPVTVSLPLGQSFVIGRQDGSVELWTDGVKQVLRAPGVEAEITQIVEYDRPLQDAQGNTLASSFVGSIAGTTLTVTALGAGGSVVVGQQITGAGVAPGTTITKYIEQTPRCAEKDGSGNCVKAVPGSGGSNGGIGTYEVSVSQTVGSLGTEVTFTQPSIDAVAPGFIIGLADGAVEQWSETDGWVELHSSDWPTSRNDVTAMVAYGDGVVMGMKNGSVQMWDGPGTSTDPGTWKNNWTELQAPIDRGQSVVSIVVHKGATTADDGLVVAMDAPIIGSVAPATSLEFWDPTRGWTELESRTKSQPFVTSMTAFRANGRSVDGVAIGYSDGSVQYWNGTVGEQAGMVELHGAGWGQPVTTMVPFEASGDWGRTLAVGLGGTGAVELYIGNADWANYWRELHDSGWGAPVTTMTTYSSASLGSGLIVGLGGGSVQLWSERDWPEPYQPGNPVWTELHDNSWGAAIATMIPAAQNVADAQGNVGAQDGVVVGLGDGSVQQWSGLISGATGQADWTAIVCAPSGCVSPTPDLNQPGVLQSAVNFGVTAAGQTSPTWGAPGNVGGPDDPLFSKIGLQPPCVANNSCNGNFVPIASYIPTSLYSTTLPNAEANPNVELRYDVNTVLYGYAFVPASVWDKLSPGKWSFAALTAVETGPALTLNLGEGGTISTPTENLFDYQYSIPGPLGFDRLGLGVGVDGALSAQILCNGGGTCPDQLNAHAYLVPGVLVTYNTQSQPKTVSLGFNYYPDLNYSDFASVSGVSVTTTLTPYVNVSYGIWIPESVWIVGGWSLFKLGVGYENPVATTVSADLVDGASLNLNSQGFLTTHAGILESVTAALTWDNTFQV
ncbi:MAG: Ig-like domain-containing protein, partial [Mycobacterium sp.]|nr:Ig-like domain-containing protein [Mycobacterium sp.]